MFGPVLTGAARDWSHLSEIRFDVEMISYSGITSPSQFTAAVVEVHGFGPDLSSLIWDLDVTGWEFGQIRTFVVPVSQPSRLFGNQTKEQILANAESVNLLFSKEFLINTSSAYVDNFVVTSTPEPSSLAMLCGAGMLIGAEYWRRRSVQIRNSARRSA
jgi:hypothetical protein